MSLRSKLSNLLRIVASLILIVWLLRLVDVSQLARALTGANFLYIILIMMLANLDRIFMAYKWDFLLKAKNIHLPLFSLIGTYYRASFWGYLFLPTIGTDAIRAYEIAKQTDRAEDVISSIAVERVLGLIATCLIGVLGLGLFIWKVDASGWRNLIKLIVFLTIAMIVFVLSMRLKKVQAILERPQFSRFRLANTLGKILVSYQSYAHSKLVLIVFLLLSIVEQFSPIVDTYLVSKALNIDVDFITLLMFVPVIMLIVRLPISFDGFGVREGLYVYLFGLTGLPQSQAFLLGFVPTILSRLAVAPVTLYFFWVSKKETKPGGIDQQVEATSMFVRDKKG